MNESQSGSQDSPRVQGEGDYESARRFNEKERRFVEQHGSPRQPPLDPEQERELQSAEEEARERSDEVEHDEIDEQFIRQKLDDRGDPPRPQ